jgi:hypothetical protein
LRASKAVLARQKGYHVWGYPKYHPIEKEIFEKNPTPNDYITHIRQHGETGFPPNIHLEDMINPLTKWLGRLPKYLTQEHRVMMAVDIKALGLALPISSAAKITILRAINLTSSPPVNILANQYTAALGSLPRIDLIKAEIMS